MPGVLDPKSSGGESSTGGGSSIDTAQVQAIVDSSISAAKPDIVQSAIDTVTPQIDTKVNGAVTAVKPTVVTDVEADLNATMDSKIQTQVQSQLGQSVIDEVTLQFDDREPLIEQNVMTAVQQDMSNFVETSLDARQPTIVQQVKDQLNPDLDLLLQAHEPDMVAQVTAATNTNIDQLVDVAVQTHYPDIVAAMWADADTQIQTELSDAFQAERATIVGQVLNSIGDVDRAEVIIATNRGIKANAQHHFTGGSIAQGSTTFTDLGAVFADTDIGKLIYVVGAGANGSTMASVIASRTDIRTVELQDPAAVGVTNAEYLYGTDDTAAWVALLDTLFDNMVSCLVIPYGLSLTDPLAVKNNTKIMGMQNITWGQKQVGNTSGLLLKPGAKGPGLIYGVNNAVVNVQLDRVVLDGADRFHPNTVTRYTGGSVTKDSNLFNAVNGTFTAADVGKKLVVYAAGATTGGDFVGTIFAVNSPTQVVVDTAVDPHPFAVTLNNLAYSYGFYTSQGTDGVTILGSNVFNAASASFTAEDVGRAIELTAVMTPTWTGDGRGELLSTVIKAVNSPTQVVLESTVDLALTSVRWRVGMMHGVYQKAQTVGQQTAWDFDNVLVRNVSGTGIVVNALQRGNKMFRTYTYRARGIGMLINSSYNELIQSGTLESGGDGATILKAGNKLTNFNSISNNGNGVYIGVGGENTQLTACQVDQNDRNGVLCFARGLQSVSMRMNSNSQCANGVYSDIAYTRRYATGVVGTTPAGCSLVAGYWVLNGNGNKPAWGVESAGPNTIHGGTGVQYDASTSPFATAAISQPAVFGMQSSFAMEAGTQVTLVDNNAFSSKGINGTKLGLAATEKWGFYGAVPIARPTVSGKSSTSTAVKSIASALAALGLVTNNIT